MRTAGSATRRPRCARSRSRNRPKEPRPRAPRDPSPPAAGGGGRAAGRVRLPPHDRRGRAHPRNPAAGEPHHQRGRQPPDGRPRARQGGQAPRHSDPLADAGHHRERGGHLRRRHRPLRGPGPGAGLPRRQRARIRLHHRDGAGQAAGRRRPAVSAARTLTELFFGASDRYGSRTVALRFMRGGRWLPISYAELLEQVRNAAAALRDLGIVPGDRLAILSENRPEWAITHHACLACRCADVPVYPTLPARQAEYILQDSGAVAVCVSNRTQLDKIGEIRASLPALRHVIAFEPGLDGPGVLGFEELLARGRAARERWPGWRQEALRVTPDDLATIIYTSGTTGEPKGVMLTHGNIASNVAACLPILPMTDRDECLSLLPLSHIFERMAGHYLMFDAGVVISYAESVEAVQTNLVEIRPTVCCAVPRVYEKVYARALELASTASPIRKKIFFWAKRVGDEWTTRRLGGRMIPLDLRFARMVANLRSSGII